VSFRDTVVQLGFVMVALGAVIGTWALLTGPLAKWTDRLSGRRSTRREASSRRGNGS